jgi:hypothetical protein
MKSAFNPPSAGWPTPGHSKYPDFLLAFCDNPDNNVTNVAGNIQPLI